MIVQLFLRRNRFSEEGENGNTMFGYSVSRATYATCDRSVLSFKFMNFR